MKVVFENTFLRPCILLAAFCATLAPSHARSASELVECTVILDQKTGAAIIRTGTCAERFTPMSTFKVPLALMGYDAGWLT